MTAFWLMSPCSRLELAWQLLPAITDRPRAPQPPLYSSDCLISKDNTIDWIFMYQNDCCLQNILCRTLQPSIGVQGSSLGLARLVDSCKASFS
jgi:hypothetical protein